MKVYKYLLMCFFLIALNGYGQEEAAKDATPAVTEEVAAETEEVAMEEDDDDLMEMDLGDLLDMEVTSVSKKAEPLFKASSAIYVITAEDMKRRGARNIPEALRGAPGVQVNQLTASQYQVSIRGFNEVYSNKLLVMVDGRTVYTPTFSGVYWDTLDVNMADIAQIEVIRGPGATLWGANAVNGVVNIITKSTKDTLGGNITLGSGNQSHDISGRYGWELSEDVTARFYTKYNYYEELEDSDLNGDDDSWEKHQYGMRLDWQISESELLTAQGDFYVANQFHSDTDKRGSNFVLAYDKSHDDGSSTSAKFFYNGYDSESDTLLEDMDTYDFDVQHRWEWDNHEMTLGGGYRTTHGRYEQKGFVNIYSDHYEFYNLYLQDKITISDTFSVTPGVKAEYNSYTNAEIMPSLRAAWTPNENHTVWGAISKAVRTPSFFENGSKISTGQSFGPYGVYLRGNENQISEELMAYELGYRVKPTDTVSLDFTAYYFDYDEIRSYDESNFTLDNVNFEANIPLENGAKAETYGFEAAAKWIASEDWTLSGSFTMQKMKVEEAPGVSLFDDEDAVPNYMASINSYHRITNKLGFNAAAYFQDNITAYNTGSQVRVDLGFVYQATENLEITLHGANLTEGFTQEASGTVTGSRYKEIPRSVFVGLSYNF
jgi:iron complex outermembrane recepter protein